MKKLSSEELEKIKKVVVENHYNEKIIFRYLLNYSFVYFILLFILFKFGFIRDTILLNWLSNLLSYFIPLIDIYVHKYNYYAAANMYSLLIVGLVFFLFLTLKQKKKIITPLIGNKWDIVKTIFFKLFAFLLFGSFLLIACSEVFVSVQYTCTETMEFNRACIGLDENPSETGFHHLLLMLLISLFWLAWGVASPFGTVPNFIIKKYHL